MDKIFTSWAPEIGAGGVLCYLILKLVFQFLEKKNPPAVASPVICPMAKAFDADQFKTVAEQSKDLWDWHNKEDPATGKKLWYSNSDSHLVAVLERSAAASEAQILVLTKLTAQVEHMTKGVERMEQDLKGLRS